ncbi:glycosyltransferase family 2 protein [Longispora sp. K20-0274]|uniref:glycosyltransferase family 2 protein n=1 Tax=Longispora sp. K20-0274 TaxID=3088255 RepID=UPI00399B70D4
MTQPFPLSVVVPCHNEEDNVRPCYAEIIDALGGCEPLQVLFVDDGSTDGTLAEIRELAAGDPRVGYLSFSRNFGLEAAFSAGYAYAAQPWILHLDADLQFPPAEGLRLIDKALEGYDAVFGVRPDRQDSGLRKLASYAHDRIARGLLGIQLPPGATCFRLVRADLARRIVRMRLGTPYFLATVPKLTRAWTTVPTAHRPRLRGASKVSVRGLAKHSVELFVSYSDRLLTFAAVGCLAGAAVALAGFPGIGLALGLLALALVARYLVHLSRGGPRPPQFLIRESNLAVAATDLLHPEETP